MYILCTQDTRYHPKKYQQGTKQAQRHIAPPAVPTYLPKLTMVLQCTILTQQEAIFLTSWNTVRDPMKLKGPLLRSIVNITSLFRQAKKPEEDHL